MPPWRPMRRWTRSPPTRPTWTGSSAGRTRRCAAPRPHPRARRRHGRGDPPPGEPMSALTPVVVDPQTGVADLAELIQAAGGLAPLPAARLALAAVELIGEGRGATVEVAAVSGR